MMIYLGNIIIYFKKLLKYFLLIRFKMEFMLFCLIRYVFLKSCNLLYNIECILFNFVININIC